MKAWLKLRYKAANPSLYCASPKGLGAESAQSLQNDELWSSLKLPKDVEIVLHEFSWSTFSEISESHYV